jgi:hypothetical protein
MEHMLNTVRRDESGLSKLEALGLFAFVVSLLSLITPIREFTVNFIGIVFGQVDPETGHPNDFSTAMRGFAIVGGAVLVFIGSGWLLLWTNLGKRLAFLLTGAGTFGWLVINGILFVVYAPRGIRPGNLEGLNSIQIRLPAIAMTAGSLVLLLMFLTALSRYESETD